jgi:hypothetical protein
MQQFSRNCWLSVSHLSDTETILFETPKDNCKVFVSNLRLDISLDDLRSLFARFGAIYDTWIDEPCISASIEPEVHQNFAGENNALGNGPSTWAIVTFFSSAAATSSLSLHGAVFGSRPLKVSLFRRRITLASPDSPQSRPLSVRRSVELMNTFFPMRWTSEVVSMDVVEFQSCPADQSAVFLGSWRCCTKLVLDGAIEVFGVGLGTHSGEKYEVIQRAKKLALSDARKDAFSRMAVVLTSGSKVGLYVSPTPLVPRPLELKGR